MEENPYKSPQLEQRELSLTWRRVVSLPLIVFGVLLQASLPFGLVEFLYARTDELRTTALIEGVLGAIVGVTLVWVGFRLRRRA